VFGAPPFSLVYACDSKQSFRSVAGIMGGEGIAFPESLI